MNKFDAKLLETCQSNRRFPDWVLEEFDIPKRTLLETRDQAFKRQNGIIQWKMVEREMAK